MGTTTTLRKTDLFAVERDGITHKLTADQIVVDRPYVQVRSGRVYCYSNNRWVTDSDDVYGVNYTNLNENCGSSSEPEYKWEHLGAIVVKGTIVNKLTWACVANSNRVDDLEFRVVIRYPNPISKWSSGVTSDNDQTVVEIGSGLFSQGLTGDMRGLRKNTFDFQEYEMLEDGFLSIYVRPIGNINGTKQARSTWIFEFLPPSVLLP